MTCNICCREIAAHAPVVLLNIALDGHVTERFTGVAWHPECAPVEREHLVEEARALLARGRMRKLRDEVSLDGRLEVITAMDLRRAPGEVLASVELGKRFVITRSGKPIAMLTQPPCDLSDDWFPKRRRARPEVKEMGE